MSANTTAKPLIEITPRGPSIAGTRITVYSMMDLIKSPDWNREEIIEVMRITPEQLDAVYDYIEQHREEVEAEYARILERSAKARAESERIMRERSSFPPDMPWEERSRLMREKLAARQKAAQSQNGHHNPH
jgi:uncharacterized protein (DUF433 family)